MPRRPRCYLPGVPAHVFQRGNNRQACFFRRADYECYRELLAEGMTRYGAQLHAYVLMTNHVHLLVTPLATDSISRVLQHLGRQYVGFVNAVQGRTGTLWEGRHRASVIDAERYLFACHRYIELNPVRAGIVTDPGDYPWSSYRHHALGIMDPLVTPHAAFLRLGGDDSERRSAWRTLVAEALDQALLNDIRQAVTRNYPLGDGAFRRRIASDLERHVGYAQRGRPEVQEGSE